MSLVSNTFYLIDVVSQYSAIVESGLELKRNYELLQNQTGPVTPRQKYVFIFKLTRLAADVINVCYDSKSIIERAVLQNGASHAVVRDIEETYLPCVSFSSTPTEEQGTLMICKEREKALISIANHNYQLAHGVIAGIQLAGLLTDVSLYMVDPEQGMQGRTAILVKSWNKTGRVLDALRRLYSDEHLQPQRILTKAYYVVSISQKAAGTYLTFQKTTLANWCTLL